jgi:UDP-glucose 4-epimerase
MNIFVTGGTGFVGRNFIKKAIKNNFIFATTRKVKNLKYKNLKWLYGNFEKNWKNELKKTDVLVHLAAAGVKESGKEKKNYIYNVNVVKSLKLLLNAIKNNCKNFVIISTSSEYGKISFDKKKLFIKSLRKPNTHYALSKAFFSDIVCELSAKYRCNVRLMRLFPTYGNYEPTHRLLPSLKKAALAGNNFIIKNPCEIRDFTNVNYVSKVILDACNFKKNKFEGFSIYHISQNRPVTVGEFAKKYWKIYKAKGKLIFKNKRSLYTKHVSSHSSVWKL